jgi:ribonuclease III
MRQEEAGQRSAEALAPVLLHVFARPALLEQALTHTSMVGVNRRQAGRGYERLEFLGDRVLGLIIAEWLLQSFPDEQEGALARRLTALVREETLAHVAASIGLGRYIRLSPGERATEGEAKPAILADACEAVIGALYLDGGWSAALRFVRRHWEETLKGAKGPPQDPKTALQEWTLAQALGLPLYEEVSRQGPDHAPLFKVQVSVIGQEPVVASGPSKRAAEKAAAQSLLERINTP